MTDAPERIWIEAVDGCPYFYEEYYELIDVDSPVTGYIRADLAEAMEAENQRLREALKRIANCREDAHAHDDDMGHLRRVFDVETVMFMEAMARAALSGEGET